MIEELIDRHEQQVRVQMKGDTSHSRTIDKDRWNAQIAALGECRAAHLDILRSSGADGTDLVTAFLDRLTDLHESEAGKKPTVERVAKREMYRTIGHVVRNVTRAHESRWNWCAHI